MPPLRVAGRGMQHAVLLKAQGGGRSAHGGQQAQRRWTLDPGGLAHGPNPAYTPATSHARPDVLGLSIAERIQLAGDIRDRIPAEGPESAALTSRQLGVVQARLDTHDRDPATAVSWERIRAELLRHGC